MADKPTTHASLSALSQELAAPEPFVLALSGSRRVTFRDPFGAGLDDFERLEELHRSRDGSIRQDLAVLESMMSPEDYRKYRAENPSARVHKAVLEAVFSHFGASMTDVGGSVASRG